MARNFNGTTDVINCSANATTVTNNFTIAAWMKSVAFASDQTIFGNGGTIGWALEKRATANKLSLLKTGLGFIDSAFSLTDGVWTHIGITVVGTTVSYFVNGVAQGTAALGSISTPNAGMSIGADNATRFFKGAIADCAIWTVPLTATEFASLGKGIRPYNIREANLVAFFPVDGLQSPEPDISGFAHNGTVTGTTLASGPPFAPFTPRWPMGAILPSTIPPAFILMPQIAT